MSDPTSPRTAANDPNNSSHNVTPDEPSDTSAHCIGTEADRSTTSVVVPAPVVHGPSPLELEEDTGRIALEREHQQTILVAALCETVGLEETCRHALMAEERCTWGSLSDDASSSLTEALAIWRLENELRSLQDEDEKLRVIIESQEVLLDYSVKTHEYITYHSDMLTTTSEKLDAANEMVAATTGRLMELPTSEHASLRAALSKAEDVVMGKGDEPTTRSQLVDAWQSLQGSTDGTEAGDDETARRDLASVLYGNTTARCDAVLQRHQDLCQTIDALFQNHEAALLEAVERKESEIKELGRTFDAEIGALETARKHLKQVEDEQLFHIRRGTFIKERQDHLSHDALLAERVKQKHTHLCEAKLKVEKEIEIVSNDVRDAKRSLEDLKRVMDESRHQTATRKHDFMDEQLSASRTRALLEQENEDLRLLKSDLTKVLQFVKLKNKDE